MRKLLKHSLFAIFKNITNIISVRIYNKYFNFFNTYIK